MMTDRLFHNGAYNCLRYLNDTKTFMYLFKQTTLNVLPVDPIWRDDRALPANQFGTFQFKDLGIAHGDDVSDCDVNELSSATCEMF
jgi:hypothetical protein